MAQLLSVGTIIDRAWAHYTKHFLALMSISAWLLLIAILNIVSGWISPETLLLTGQNAGPLASTQIAGIVIYGITFLILAPIISIWTSNQLIKAIDQQLSSVTVNPKALSKFAWKHFLPRVCVGFLTGIMMLAPFLLVIPGGVVGVVANLSQSVPLSALGALLIFLGTILGGIGCTVLAVRFLFTPFSLLLNDQRGRAAIRASTALSRGRFWAVFFRVVIPAVVFYIAMTTIQVILVYVMKTVILSVTGLNVALAAQLFNMGRSTLFIIINTIVAPLIITANCLVYRDLIKNR